MWIDITLTTFCLLVTCVAGYPSSVSTYGEPFSTPTFTGSTNQNTAISPPSLKVPLSKRWDADDEITLYSPRSRRGGLSRKSDDTSDQSESASRSLEATAEVEFNINPLYGLEYALLDRRNDSEDKPNTPFPRKDTVQPLHLRNNPSIDNKLNRKSEAILDGGMQNKLNRRSEESSDISDSGSQHSFVTVTNPYIGTIARRSSTYQPSNESALDSTRSKLSRSLGTPFFDSDSSLKRRRNIVSSLRRRLGPPFDYGLSLRRRYDHYSGANAPPRSFEYNEPDDEVTVHAAGYFRTGTLRDFDTGTTGVSNQSKGLSSNRPDATEALDLLIADRPDANNTSVVAKSSERYGNSLGSENSDKTRFGKRREERISEREFVLEKERIAASHSVRRSETIDPSLKERSSTFGHDNLLFKRSDERLYRSAGIESASLRSELQQRDDGNVLERRTGGGGKKKKGKKKGKKKKKKKGKKKKGGKKG